MPYADFDRFRYVDNSGEPDTVASALVSTFSDAPRGSAFGIMIGTGSFEDFFPADLQLPAADGINLSYVRLSLLSANFRLSHWMYHAPSTKRIQRVELSIDLMPGISGGADFYRATRTIYLSRANGVIDSPISTYVDLTYTLDYPPNIPPGLLVPHFGGKPHFLAKERGKKSTSGSKTKTTTKLPTKKKKRKDG